MNPLLHQSELKMELPDHHRDFALLHPLDEGRKVSPIFGALLKVIENTSFAFIDLGQDETRVVGRGRVGIHRVRKLRTLDTL